MKGAWFSLSVAVAMCQFLPEVLGWNCNWLRGNGSHSNRVRRMTKEHTENMNSYKEERAKVRFGYMRTAGMMNSNKDKDFVYVQMHACTVVEFIIRARRCVSHIKITLLREQVYKERGRDMTCLDADWFRLIVVHATIFEFRRETPNKFVFIILSARTSKY